MTCACETPLIHVRPSGQKVCLNEACGRLVVVTPTTPKVPRP